MQRPAGLRVESVFLGRVLERILELDTEEGRCISGPTGQMLGLGQQL